MSGVETASASAVPLLLHLVALAGNFCSIPGRAPLGPHYCGLESSLGVHIRCRDSRFVKSIVLYIPVGSHQQPDSEKFK